MAATIGNLLIKLGLDIDDLKKGRASASRELAGFSEDLTALGKTLTFAITLPLAGVIAAITKTTLEFDALRLGLTAVTESAVEANRQFYELRQVAKLPGLGFQDAIQGATALQAAGLSASEATQALKGFGNALATIGRGRDDLKLVTLALQQIATATGTFGQEIRQLQQRIPQIRKLMLETFGTARTEELGLTGPQFLRGLLPALNRIPKVTSSLKNEFENLKDSIEVAMFHAGESIKPFIRIVLEGANSIVANLERIAKAFASLPIPVRAVTVGVGSLLTVVPLIALGAGALERNWARVVNLVRRGLVLFGLIPPSVKAAAAATAETEVAVAATIAKTAQLRAQWVALVGLVTKFRGGLIGIALSFLAEDIIRALIALGKLAGRFLELEKSINRSKDAAKGLREILKQPAQEGEPWWVWLFRGGDPRGALNITSALEGLVLTEKDLEKANDEAANSFEQFLRLINEGWDKAFGTETGKKADDAGSKIEAAFKAAGFGAKGLSGDILELEGHLTELQSAYAKHDLLGGQTKTRDDYRVAINKLKESIAKLREEYGKDPAIEEYVKRISAAIELAGQKFDKSSRTIVTYEQQLSDLRNSAALFRSLAEEGVIGPRQFGDAIQYLGEKMVDITSKAKQFWSSLTPGSDVKQYFDLAHAALPSKEQMDQLGRDLQTRAIARGEAPNQLVFPSIDAEMSLAEINKIIAGSRELTLAYLDVVGTMTKGNENIANSMKGLSSNTEQYFKLIESAKDLNFIPTKVLEEQANAAWKIYIGLKDNFLATEADRLQAYMNSLLAERQFVQSIMYKTGEDEKKAYQRRLKEIDGLLRTNKDAYEKLAADSGRYLNDVEGFWRRVDRQISTILTDLSRSIADILFPRTQGPKRDVDAIADLGIRAGVSGEQLDILALKIEQLATATGQNFGRLAQLAGDTFREFGIAANNQIPTLERFFEIAVGSGLGIDDLFDTVVKYSGLLRDLGISATDAAALFARLSSQGEDADSVFKSLEDALKSLTERGFADPVGELQQLIDRIKEAKTDTEANELALRHFGDAGVVMARIIREGKLSLNDLGNAFNDIQTDISKASDEVEEFDRKANETSKLKELFLELARGGVRVFVEESITQLGKFIGKLLGVHSVVEGLKAIFIGLGKKILDIFGVGGSATKAIENITSKVSDTSDILTDVLSNAGKAADEAASTAESIGGAVSKTGGAAGGAVSGAFSGVLGILNTAFAGVSAVTGVINTFQMARQENTLNAIEENTRFGMLHSLFTLLKVNEHLPKLDDITNYLWSIQADILRQIHDRLVEISRHTAPLQTGVLATATPATEYNTVINNFYIDGSVTSTDDLARSVSEAAARLYSARGIKNRPRIVR